MNVHELHPELHRYAKLAIDKEINYITDLYEKAKNHIRMSKSLAIDSLKYTRGHSESHILNEQLRELKVYVSSVYDKISDSWPKIEHLGIAYEDLPNLKDYKAAKSRILQSLLDVETVITSSFDDAKSKLSMLDRSL